MFKPFDRKRARIKRHLRLRKKVRGTGTCPRLSVFRSLKHIYAQIIDDESGRTLVASSSLDPKLRAQLQYGGNIDAATAVGTDIAQKAQAAGIKQVVFDRGGNIYHGRVAALATAARAAGLEF